MKRNIKYPLKVILNLEARDFINCTFSEPTDCVIARSARRQWPNADRVSDGLNHLDVDCETYDHEMYSSQHFRSDRERAELARNPSYVIRQITLIRR